MELRNTFEFVSSGAPLKSSAYIFRDTGKICWHADLEEEEDLPEDLETSDPYIEVPHKNTTWASAAVSPSPSSVRNCQTTPRPFQAFSGGAGHIVVSRFCWTNAASCKSGTKNRRWNRLCSRGARRMAFGWLIDS